MAKGSPILTVRLPQTEVDRLRRASAKLSIPVAQIVRDAIAAQLAWVEELPEEREA